MNGILTFRPARPEDEPFLRILRSEIDSDRLKLNLWQPGNDKLKDKLLDLQFRGFDKHVENLKNFQETEEKVITLNDIPVGRFVVAGDREELRIAELAVLKEYRGVGIGNMIIGMTKQECVRTSRVVRLYVEKTNPALQSYLGEGFYVISTESLHYILEWNPKGPTSGRLYSFAKGV